MVYLAKVSNAATADARGLKWFKIAEDGLTTSNGQWGVDRMINNNGWQYFDMPSCVAPGNYLMRVELIALHSAYSQGGAQFYVRSLFLFSVLEPHGPRSLDGMRSDQCHRWR
jgi:cellulase